MKKEYIKPQIILVDCEMPLLTELSKSGTEDSTGGSTSGPGIGEFSKGTSWNLWEEDNEDNEEEYY